MIHPNYLTYCEEERWLNAAMDKLINEVAVNLDLGYHLDLESISDSVQNGMTKQTFNMLVCNVNNMLREQFENSGRGMSSSAILHAGSNTKH